MSVKVICTYCFVGYGVFATQNFSAGEFLLDYHGVLITQQEGNSMADQTYVYYFQLNGGSYW